MPSGGSVSVQMGRLLEMGSTQKSYLPLYMALAQSTCSWPRFPKAWESDSGIGEPEEKPVQAGAAMTAMVYRAEGRLAQADEVEFMRRWGTAEGLGEAMAR